MYLSRKELRLFCTSSENEVYTSLDKYKLPFSQMVYYEHLGIQLTYLKAAIRIVLGAEPDLKKKEVPSPLL